MPINAPIPSGYYDTTRVVECTAKTSLVTNVNLSIVYNT